MSAPLTWPNRRALWGLGVALAVVVGLTGWLYAGVSGDLAAQQKQREAVLVANAIGASLAGADEAAATDLVRRWKEAAPRLDSVLVIAGRQLVASTRAADEAPRGLRRD